VFDPANVLSRLKVDEGFSGKPYKDSVGKTTIGYGRNLDDCPLTPAEAEFLMQGPLAQVTKSLDNALPWWKTLDDVRQGVLVQMTYNMGIQKVLGFQKMLAALRNGLYVSAATEMVDSLWAKQVGDRAHRLAEEMETGFLQP
jgi:lysozyme